MNSFDRDSELSVVEVTNIDTHGVWLCVRGKEYFLPYDRFPWFKDARVGDILAVQLHHESHLRWESLDVDLTVESLESPEGFPLVYV